MLKVRVRPQKEEKRLLPLLNDGALRLLINYRASTFIQWRVHAVACTILDAGCRIEELLTARVLRCGRSDGSGWVSGWTRTRRADFVRQFPWRPRVVEPIVHGAPGCRVHTIA
jgi:hypothetical protein